MHTSDRRGRALSLKGNHEEAEADFNAAATSDPSCAADMEKEVVANEQRAKAAERKQRGELKNFLNKKSLRRPVNWVHKRLTLAFLSCVRCEVFNTYFWTQTKTNATNGMYIRLYI